MAGESEGEGKLGCDGGFTNAAFARQDLGVLMGVGEMRKWNRTHEDDILYAVKRHGGVEGARSS